METWILIIYFGYRSGGIGVEFTSKERCESAIVQLGRIPEKAFCTLK